VSEAICRLEADGTPVPEEGSMVDEGRRSYPGVPAKNWWDLRRRFQQAVPGKVDPDYLQSVLGIGEGAAKNLIPQLTAVGLIDEGSKPTDLAMDWRDDGSYPAACLQILEAVYPQALRDAMPPPGPPRDGVEKWFARNVKVGQGAASKMASFYLLVAAADLTAQRPDGKMAEAKPKVTTSALRRAAPKPVANKAAAPETGSLPAPVPPAPSADDGPSVHVDVQVHISPDASAEQIDQIFASMAKHLYGRK
jgi:Family of unknown function (DUF5343)